MEIKTYICRHCQIKFRRAIRHEKRLRNIFCSPSCRSSYYSKRNSTKRTSKIEEAIYSVLRKRWEKIHILRNDRKFLLCGYEIDIFIPSKKLAIEVNGPIHYKPIHGEERLKQARHNDFIKKAELTTRNISLIIIDVGSDTYKRKHSETELEAEHLVRQYLPVESDE